MSKPNYRVSARAAAEQHLAEDKAKLQRAKRLFAKHQAEVLQLQAEALKCLESLRRQATKGRARKSPNGYAAFTRIRDIIAMNPRWWRDWLGKNEKIKEIVKFDIHKLVQSVEDGAASGKRNVGGRPPKRKDYLVWLHGGIIKCHAKGITAPRHIATELSLHPDECPDISKQLQDLRKNGKLPPRQNLKRKLSQ
jgi:hypothetical protein